MLWGLTYRACDSGGFSSLIPRIVVYCFTRNFKTRKFGSFLLVLFFLLTQKLNLFPQQTILDVAKGVIPESQFCTVCEV